MENSLAKVQKDANSFLAIGNKLLEKSESLTIAKVEDTQIANSILKECQQTEKEIESKRVQITKPLNDFVSNTNTLFKEITTPVLQAKNTIKQKIVAYNNEQERIRREEEAKRLAEERERLRKLEEERIERERVERIKQEEEERKLKAEQERLRKLDEERLAKEMEARKASEEEQAKLRAEAEKQRLEKEKLERERLELEQQKREVEEEKRRQEEQRMLDEAKKKQDEELANKAKEMKIKGIVKSWQWEIVDEQAIPRAFCSPDSKKINESIKAGIREIRGLRIFEATTVR